MNKIIDQEKHWLGLIFVGIVGLVMVLTGHLDPNMYWGFLALNFVTTTYVEGKKVKYKPHHDEQPEKKKP